MRKFTTDELMQSLDGINRAEAPPFLRTRVFAALHQQTEKPIAKWIPAMAMLLLMGILLSNIFLYSNTASIPAHKSNTPNQFFQTYSLPSTPSLYEQDIEQ
jgi:hypothetical protein